MDGDDLWSAAVTGDFNPPSHQSNSKRQNLGVQTTQLASKKHFADKRNQFNLTSLKGNKTPGYQATSNYQHGGNQNMQTSKEKDVSDGHFIHPNNKKDGILLGNSHEDKALFYNTRSNSGTGHPKFGSKPDNTQQTSEDYNKYNYSKNDKPNDQVNFKNPNFNKPNINKPKFNKGYGQDQSSIEVKPNTNQYKQGQSDAVDERIKQLYNETLKEKESGERNSSSLSRFDVREDERVAGRFSGRVSQNESRCGNRDANGNHTFGAGGAERGGWNGNDYTERGDRYSSGKLEMDSRYGGRDAQESSRYGGRGTDHRFGGRNEERGDRSGDRDLLREGRYDNREPRRDERFGPERFGKFDEESNRRETPYYIVEKGQDQRRDYGIEKQEYHVKSNRNVEYPTKGNRNVEYPSKGNRNAAYRNGQELNRTEEQSRGNGNQQYSHSRDSGKINQNKNDKNDSLRLSYKHACVKDDTKIANRVGDGMRQQGSLNGNLDSRRGYMNPYERSESTYNPASRRNIAGGNYVSEISKHDHKKGNKGDIKQMLIDAGNKSVLNYRKARVEKHLSSDLKMASNSYATIIASHLANSVGNVRQPRGNPTIKFIVNPMGNQSIVYGADNLMGNPLVQQFATPLSTINPVAKTSVPNMSVGGVGHNANTVGNPSIAASFPATAVSTDNAVYFR